MFFFRQSQFNFIVAFIQLILFSYFSQKNCSVYKFNFFYCKNNQRQLNQNAIEFLCGCWNDTITPFIFFLLSHFFCFFILSEFFFSQSFWEIIFYDEIQKVFKQKHSIHFFLLKCIYHQMFLFRSVFICCFFFIWITKSGRWPKAKVGFSVTLTTLAVCYIVTEVEKKAFFSSEFL